MTTKELLIGFLKILKDARTGHEEANYDDGYDEDGCDNAFDSETRERLLELIRKAVNKGSPGKFEECKGCERRLKEKCEREDYSHVKELVDGKDCVFFKKKVKKKKPNKEV